MTKTLPITEARHKLKELTEEFAGEHEPGAVAVTRRGKPVLAVMPWDLYETIMETLEVLGDEELTESLRLSIQDLRDGKTIPWEEVKKDLGL
ncbi:MAG: type II toxin-antitoxin system Phd/YefM family antitoxin [Deltaproteobacteria bacterium]|nr:type II toxin-antitoxin system Phd/YefM family antitoxin [Deltaproteobacteria bacterium]